MERNYRIHSLKLKTILDLKHWCLWDCGGFPQWIYGICLGFMGFAPENGWLKDYFCFAARPIFRGELLVLGRIIQKFITLRILGPSNGRVNELV